MSAQDHDMETWKSYVAWFKEHKEEIRVQYGDTTYVAIYDYQVVDYDPDKFELAKRIESRYPNEDALITSVKSSERIVVIEGTFQVPIRRPWKTSPASELSKIVGLVSWGRGAVEDSKRIFDISDGD